ncbi:helix-turn-helix transcriptional regulator [Reyranella sp.]|uniref:helix-turn-helix transcriptional regulator n=1 Tax=Reyranella sp. TaxID=1929291 RepID=UPI0040354EE4
MGLPPSANESHASKIRHEDLVAFSRLVGNDYRAMGAALDATATMVAGKFNLREVRAGLLVHASDARYEHTVTTQMEKNQSLNFSIVLSGGWQATLGGTSLASGAGPSATTFVLSEPDLWQKHAVRGGHARMVNVMASPEWLEASILDGSGADSVSMASLTRRHRLHAHWRPSARLVGLADRVLGTPLYAAGLQKLYLESRAIDIVLESLSLLVESRYPAGSSGRPGDHRRMWAVRERLDHATHETPSLSELAREASVSTRTLQRQFAAVHGIAIFEYVRSRRLDRSRRLLEREGISVAQAAYEAGYSSAANFATAFRRRFGLSPRQARDGV